MTWEWLVPILYGLSAVATASAWALYMRTREHLSVAVLLSTGLASDLAIKALRDLYLNDITARLGVNAPWFGWPRIAGHMTDALSMAWPAAIAGAAYLAFLQRRPWPVVAAYTLTMAGLVIVHPIAGDGSLGRALTAVELVSVMVALGCAATWYQRSGERTTSAQACMVVVICTELASLAGSWRLGVLTDWHFTQIAYLAGFVVLIAMQWSWSWLNPSSSVS